MRVGIIGCGVVGQRLIEWFANHSVPVSRVDPEHGLSDSLKGCSIVFVCVPTSLIDGHLDTSIIRTALAKADLDDDAIVALRSTVLPGTTRALAEADPRRCYVHVPEFLTERRAKDDFLHPEVSIVGTVDPEDERGAGLLLIDVLPTAGYSRICTAEVAELAKVSSNAFYATKLSFMNQLYDYAEVKGIDYADVKDLLTGMSMVGSQHLDVLQDGYRGFGGKCLPKDSSALAADAARAGATMTVLDEAIAVNATLRLKGG